MAEDFRITVKIEHGYRGWSIVGSVPLPGAYQSSETIFEEEQASIRRVIEVSDVLGPDVTQRVRERLRSVAVAAEEALAAAHERTREESERAHARIAEAAVKARVARDVTDSYPPLDDDIPF